MIRDALDLIETGDRVADVAGVLQRFLALLGEGKGALRQIVASLFPRPSSLMAVLLLRYQRTEPREGAAIWASPARIRTGLGGIAGAG